MGIIGSLHAVPLHRSIYDSGCPGEKMLPWYLIIGGILTISLVAGRFVVVAMVEKCRRKGDGEERGVGCNFCRISCQSLYDVIGLVCTSIWLIAGTKFLLGIYDKVNYASHRPNEDTCDEVLFKFSLYTIICGWIAVLICTVILICTRCCQCCCYLVCCKPCRKRSN